MNWQLDDIAQAIGGERRGPDCTIHGVSTDSRQVAAGELFIALIGERFDAHDFLQEVAPRAGALLLSRAECCPPDVSALIVDDTRLALGRLAAAWRRRFTLPLLAVTGSNGKTTTKEMIAAILAAHFGDAVLATRGNLNNDIGLPLTLLGLNAGHRAGIVEMGMNHPGEIAYLAEIAAPTVAVVTNAQRAHLEGMGTLDEVAREKGSLFDGLAADGIAILNADDPQVASWHTRIGSRRALSFGLRQPADVSARLFPHGLETRMEIHTPAGDATLLLRVPGKHNALNALAAIATTQAAGVPLDAAVRGLADFTGVKGRLQRRDGPNGSTLLDDTYNANPDSVRAGINVLAATIGKTILVLGDMGEIGEASAQYHDEIGGYAKSQGIDRLFTFGDAAQLAARNFGEGGRHFCQIDKLLNALRREIDASTTVLIKGSRFMRMERIADALTTLDKEAA